MGMIGVMSTANTKPDPEPTDADMAAARAASQALAAEQLRHAAGRWPVADEIRSSASNHLFSTQDRFPGGCDGEVVQLNVSESSSDRVAGSGS